VGFEPSLLTTTVRVTNFASVPEINFGQKQYKNNISNPPIISTTFIVFNPTRNRKVTWLAIKTIVVPALQNKM
jgi:hypothetical protein